MSLKNNKFIWDASVLIIDKDLMCSELLCLFLNHSLTLRKFKEKKI